MFRRQAVYMHADRFDVIEKNLQSAPDPNVHEKCDNPTWGDDFEFVPPNPSPRRRAKLARRHRSLGQTAFDEAAAKAEPMVWVLEWPPSQVAQPEFGKSYPQVVCFPSRQVELACVPRGRREK